MPTTPVWQEAAADAAGQIVGTGLGIMFAGANDRRQIRQQRRLNKLENEQTEFNMQKQLEMWEKTGYGPQKQQMKRAGINPALMYGMGGGGSQTASITTGTGQHAPSGGGEIPAIMGLGMQLALLRAQKENIEADTEQKKAVTEKTAGVDTENVKADTANKVLQQIVTEYTGKEAKDVYERIKNPNRNIEAKTFQDELEARQGIAGTIYEMWKEGKLKDKSVAELEQLLLANAKTREETRNIYKQGEILEENLKGAKLDNIIKDLETRLQTETGIDRSSPTWLKILGRLFVELMTKP